MKVAKYILNGLVATGVHFCVLLLSIEIIDIQPVALANVFAAIFGTGSSFIGNRYFVFQAQARPVFGQTKNFLGLYTLVACIHGLVLFCWTDLSGLDYRTGFIIATLIQVQLGYLGNKIMVFKA